MTDNEKELAAAEAAKLQREIDQGIAKYKRQLKSLSRNELVRQHLQVVSDLAYLKTKFELLKSNLEKESESKND